jgi:hypothetical protein
MPTPPTRRRRALTNLPQRHLRRAEPTRQIPLRARDGNPHYAFDGAVSGAAAALEDAHCRLVGEGDAGVGGGAEGACGVVVAGCFEGAGCAVEVCAGEGGAGVVGGDDGPFFFCWCGGVEVEGRRGGDCVVSRGGGAGADGVVGAAHYDGGGGVG